MIDDVWIEDAIIYNAKYGILASPNFRIFILVNNLYINFTYNKIGTLEQTHKPSCQIK